MYLVTMDDRWLFFWTDPQRDGCPCPVIDGAEIIDDAIRQDEWHLDTNAEPHVLARSNRSPLKFNAFRSELDVPNSWEIVDETAEGWSTWEAFTRSGRQPTMATGTDEVLDGKESV